MSGETPQQEEVKNIKDISKNIKDISKNMEKITFDPNGKIDVKKAVELNKSTELLENIKNNKYTAEVSKEIQRKTAEIDNKLKPKISE
jgi:isopentenyl diphosphate isomerase/L-lactate dehydrogenase-like FMN-dependent dehydrogenase